MAENLGVQNLLFYAIIGQDLKGDWKKDVENSYKTAIQRDEKSPVVLKLVLDAFDNKRIHSMVLGGYTFREYYPKTHMRAFDTIEIFIESSKESQVQEILISQGFQFVKQNSKTEKLYYKLNEDIFFKIVTKIDFSDKKLKKHFAKPISMYKIKRNNVFIHEMEVEETYIWLVSKIAQDFYLKNLNLTSLIDLYYFQRRQGTDINMVVVKKSLESLKLFKFNDYIVKLLDFWFGKSFFPTEDSDYKALERYILTKGNQGTSFADTLLSLNIKEEKIKDKKEKSQLSEWLFPELEYMKELYPILEKKPKLLMFYRISRFTRIIAKRIKLVFISIKNYIKKQINFLKRKVKNVKYNLIDKINKNNEENT